jgi:ATP-dependent RNA helicase DbpA
VTTIATAFNTLPLSAAMLANLDSLGYAQMTPIQAQSLPVILKGMDLIAQAKTGSGKTAAFGIGLLNPINPRYFGCQALVICPTRELADQVAKEIRRLARAEDNIKVLTLCGGVSFGPQIGSLEHGAHIIVGTPGRIQQHLRKGSLVLDGLNTLVLDEADRMLDMGFYDAIEDIIVQTPAASPDPAVLGHVPGRHQAIGLQVHARPAAGQGRGVAHRQPDRAAFLRNLP